MDGTTLGALIAGITGLLAAAATSIKAWYDSRAGVKSTEVDVGNLALSQVQAAMTHMGSIVDELQETVEDLKGQVAELKLSLVEKDATIAQLTAALQRAEAYISLLVAHIEAGYGPPAPVLNDRRPD
jgi:peptidoglycan hydrolase CwlO-like protein